MLKPLKSLALATAVAVAALATTQTSAQAMGQMIRKGIEKALPRLVPKEGKIHDSTLDGPSHKQLERERTREFERQERRSRTA